MRILIIGGDAAGMSAASQIRRRQPSWTVEAFEMGLRTSYGLCGTPYYLGGMISSLDQLVTLTPQQLENDRGIKIHLRHKAVALNPARKSITVQDLATGKTRDESYDQLLLATGAEPVIPAGLEPDQPNLFYLRSIDEAGRIREKALQSKRAVVVGAGYIGLEVAENLTEAGLSVTLLGRKVAPIFELELQNLALSALARHGVEFRGDTDATGIKHLADGSLEVMTSQGEPAKGDFALVGTGVSPRSQLAAEAGLDLGARRAIAVDRYQRTSNQFIFAAGDCAESHHLVTKQTAYIALALGANRQGRMAGQNISGLNIKSPEILGTSVMKIFDLGLARTGLGFEEAQKAGYKDVGRAAVKQHSKPLYFPGSGEVTAIVIFDKITGRLLGGQLGGPVEAVGQRINVLATAITAGMTVREVSELDTAYAPPFSPVYDPVIIACEVAAKSLK